MKKIILTESQLDMVKNSVNNNDVDRFRNEVIIKIGSSGGNYNGLIVDDVRLYSNKMTLSYLIDINYRKWGIDDIYLHDIKGPSEIDVILECYQEGSDEMIEKDITIPLDWEKLYTEIYNNQGQITTNDSIDITLYFRENDNIEVEMSIDIYTL
jgi:hypothetical protein